MKDFFIPITEPLTDPLKLAPPQEPLAKPERALSWWVVRPLVAPPQHLGQGYSYDQAHKLLAQGALLWTQYAWRSHCTSWHPLYSFVRDFGFCPHKVLKHALRELTCHEWVWTQKELWEKAQKLWPAQKTKQQTKLLSKTRAIVRPL